MSISQLTSTVLLLSGLATAAKYEEYILAPRSRTLYPEKVHGFNGSISGTDSLIGSAGGEAVFDGISAVTYDFGKNIAGLVSLQIGDVDEDQFIGLTYSESSLWISNISCDATEDAGMDEPYWFQPTEGGNYTTDEDHVRGGFRYLTLVHNTTGSIAVESISVHFTAMPHYADDQIANYTGYFHCDDELLNRIWYAGAYTNQLCTIDPKTGNSLVHPELRSNMTNEEVGLTTWYNNFTIANGSAVLTDGAKRDRLIWPGDMAIAVPAIVASYYDIQSIEDSLNSLYSLQNETTGQLPYAGIPFTERGLQSDTYHLYSLIGLADHFLYTGSLDYVEGKWDQFVAGLNYSLSTIDDSKLANISYSNDWLRKGMGGHNIEANSIMYYTIQQGIMLGQAVGAEQSLLESWARSAEGIKTAANELLWNETAGFYHDNETTTLTPQDGNVWAVFANVTDSQEKNERISSGLSSRWTEVGAPSPEADNAVSPFISSFELQAHFLANNASAALALTRLQWGYMLDDPRMTNSTFMEGYEATGEFHYSPYNNDPRISMAHGWSTGPTSVLSFYVAGLHLLSDGGQTWEIYPRLGDLKFVDTGFSTRVGAFSALVNATEGVVTAMKFSTPTGTTGDVRLPGLTGSLRSSNGSSIALVDGEAHDVPGGSYTLVTNGTATGGNGTTTGTTPPAQYSGNSAATFSVSALALGAAVFAWLV